MAKIKMWIKNTGRKGFRKSLCKGGGGSDTVLASRSVNELFPMMI